jgi:hypothetical protein
MKPDSYFQHLFLQFLRERWKGIGLFDGPHGVSVVDGAARLFLKPTLKDRPVSPNFDDDDGNRPNFFQEALREDPFFLNSLPY